MSTKRIKARKYFVDKFELAKVHPLHLYRELFWHGDGSPAVPVAVLDLSDPEALIEQVAATIYEHAWGDIAKARETAKAILSKLGLLSGKAGNGKTK